MSWICPKKNGLFLNHSHSHSCLLSLLLLLLLSWYDIIYCLISSQNFKKIFFWKKKTNKIGMNVYCLRHVHEFVRHIWVPKNDASFPYRDWLLGIHYSSSSLLLLSILGCFHCNRFGTLCNHNFFFCSCCCCLSLCALCCVNTINNNNKNWLELLRQNEEKKQCEFCPCSMRNFTKLDWFKLIGSHIHTMCVCVWSAFILVRLFFPHWISLIFFFFQKVQYFIFIAFKVKSFQFASPTTWITCCSHVVGLGHFDGWFVSTKKKKKTANWLKWKFWFGSVVVFGEHEFLVFSGIVFFLNFFFFSISPCGCFWILTTSSYLYLAFLYIEPAHPYCKWLLFFVPGSKFFWVNVFSLSLSPSLFLKHLAFTFDENFPWPVK